MENPPNYPSRQAVPPTKPHLPPESKPHPAVWDCGSTLYDSFELTSFQRHLDSAISSRTLSMPHLSDRRRSPSSTTNGKKSPAAGGSKFSRSFQKLIRSVFFHGKSRTSSNTKTDAQRKRGTGDQDKLVEKETSWFVVYEGDNVVYDKDRKDNGAAVSTLNEAPEIRTLAGKTMSERFTAASISNISMISSCA